MKKNIPLTLLNVINHSLKKNSGLFVAEGFDSHILYLKDRDSKSPFYFSVSLNKDNGRYNTGKYQIAMKPASSQDSSLAHLRGDDARVLNYLEVWFSLIKKYNDISTVFDADPIISQYTREYFEEIKMEDPDAEFAPFEFEKQLLIADYLIDVKSTLIEHAAEVGKPNAISDIATSIDVIVEGIPSSTKNDLIRKISHLYARIRSRGMSFARKIQTTMFPELQKELIKKIASSVVDIATKHGPDLLS